MPEPEEILRFVQETSFGGSFDRTAMPAPEAAAPGVAFRAAQTRLGDLVREGLLGKKRSEGLEAIDRILGIPLRGARKTKRKAQKARNKERDRRRPPRRFGLDLSELVFLNDMIQDLIQSPGTIPIDRFPRTIPELRHFATKQVAPIVGSSLSRRGELGPLVNPPRSTGPGIREAELGRQFGFDVTGGFGDPLRFVPAKGVDPPTALLGFQRAVNRDPTLDPSVLEQIQLSGTPETDVLPAGLREFLDRIGRGFAPSPAEVAEAEAQRRLRRRAVQQLVESSGGPR